MHYAQQRSPGANAVGIGFVVLLHIGVGYAFLTGLGVVQRPVVPEPTQATVIVEPPKPDDYKPPEMKDLPQQDVKMHFVPIKEIPIEIKSDVQFTQVSTVVPTNRDLAPVKVPTPPADRYTAPVRLAGPPLDYPQRLVEAGKEGWVDVQCDVDETGRTSLCSVIANEGSNSFADHALNYVKNTRYTPALRNGVAVTEAHHRFHIVFSIKQDR